MFERRYDALYLPWFAWHPVVLYGPDEWDRTRRLDTSARVAWLHRVWRLRTRPRTYYAVPDEHTTNKLLHDSVHRARATEGES